MIPAKRIVMLSLMLLLTFACSNEDSSYHYEIIKLPEPLKMDDALVENPDELIKKVKYVHDYIAVEYNDEEFFELQSNTDFQDSEKMLDFFVDKKLNKSIENSIMLDENDSQKSYMVITNDNFVLKVIMEKNKEHKQIWTVTAIGILYLESLFLDSPTSL